MFDFSFSELMVVMVVALIVIGPERLPKVARTLGHLWGRAQRYVNGVKSDIERDMAIEEYRQLQQKIQSEAGALEQSVKQATLTADQQVQQINEAVAKLSSAGQATPDQVTQLPSQTAVNPSATPPANKSE
jgi:sec-independent protein translocase protein TatB